MESDRKARHTSGKPAEPGVRHRKRNIHQHRTEPQEQDSAESETDPGEAPESAEESRERGREYDIARRQMPIHR